MDASRSIAEARAGGFGARRQGGVAEALGFVVLGGLMLCAVALANGHPFFFNDSADYIATGRDIVDTLLRRFAEAPSAPPASAAGPPPAGAPAPGADPMALTYMASRSAYFSLLTGGLVAAAGVWGPVILQAGVSAWLLWLLVRVIGPARPRTIYLLTVATLALASSLPFAAAFVMPDVYAGLGVAATLLLVLYLDRLALAERIALFGLAAAAGAFHTSIWVIVLATSLAAGVLLARAAGDVGQALRRAAVGVAAAAASIAAVAAYGVAVQAFYGAKIDNPPFLMARVLEDGPGRAYLASSCEDRRWTICNYRHLPLNNANKILWDPDPATGVFFPADYATRRRLNAEEPAFVLASTMHDPVSQLLASGRNALETLVRVRVSPEYGAAQGVWRYSLVNQVVPAGPYKAARVYRGTFPLGFFDLTCALALAASLGFLAWRLTRADFLHDPAEAERLYLCAALALVVAVLANAVVCGAASGPFDRYQTRLVWLIPALALVGASRFGLSGPRRRLT